jgi:hypothetical protein
LLYLATRLYFSAIKPLSNLFVRPAIHNLLRLFLQLIAVHRVVIILQQRRKPAEVRVSAAGALLFQQRGI